MSSVASLARFRPGARSIEPLVSTGHSIASYIGNVESNRMKGASRTRLIVAAMAAVGAVSVAAQAPSRTPWGDPDLQGTWPSGALSAVPFERPPQFGLRAQLTDAEFAERAEASQRQAVADAAEFVAPGPPIAVPLGPSHWLESARASRQTSLIVDPPDGRLPPMTDDGARRAK